MMGEPLVNPCLKEGFTLVSEKIKGFCLSKIGVNPCEPFF